MLEEFNQFIRDNKAAHMAKGEVGDIAVRDRIRLLLKKETFHVSMS